jgi:hypothetical protein
VVRGYVLALLVLLSASSLACERQHVNVGYDLPDDCPGQCVRLPPLGFDGPALLWFGPAEEAPECPDRASALVFEGGGGVQDAPLNCPTCSCSQPACVFPDGATASNISVCPNDPPGASLTPFPAPASWDGSCTSPGTVPADQLGSIAIAPVTEHPCEPIKDVPQKEQPAPGFTLRAVGCAGDVLDGVCPESGYTCLPSAAPPPPGFRQCIMYLGPDDGSPVECPVDYPEQHTFYADVEDTRECTECACTQTAPSECVAYVSAYENTICSAVPLLSVQVANSPACSDVAVPNAELGSLRATWDTNNPGACEASGGESIGEAKVTGARTFCCQAPPGNSP